MVKWFDDLSVEAMLPLGTRPGETGTVAAAAPVAGAVVDVAGAVAAAGVAATGGAAAVWARAVIGARMAAAARSERGNKRGSFELGGPRRPCPLGRGLGEVNSPRGRISSRCPI